MDEREKAWNAFNKKQEYTIGKQHQDPELLLQWGFNAGWDAAFTMQLNTFSSSFDKEVEAKQMLNILANYDIKTPNKLMKVLRKLGGD